MVSDGVIWNVVRDVHPNNLFLQLSTYSIRQTLVASPLAQRVTDVQLARLIENMGGRLQHIPAFHLSIRVPLKLITPNTPFVCFRVVRRDSAPTVLAAPSGLPGPGRDWERI